MFMQYWWCLKLTCVTLSMTKTLSKFGSSLFLLVQVIILLDFTHTWNDAWVAKDEQFWFEIQFWNDAWVLSFQIQSWHYLLDFHLKSIFGLSVFANLAACFSKPTSYMNSSSFVVQHFLTCMSQPFIIYVQPVLILTYIGVSFQVIEMCFITRLPSIVDS